MTPAEITAQAVAADKRNARIWGVVFLLALAGLFYWAYKDPDLFAGTVEEAAQKKAAIDRRSQVASMDCNAAMKTQADLVIAGKGVEARNLAEVVEMACTPKSETITKIVLIILACIVGLLFVVFVSAPQF